MIDGTSLSGVSVCVCAQSISVTVCVPNREDFIFNNRDSHACAVSSVSSVVTRVSTCDLVAVPVSLQVMLYSSPCLPGLKKKNIMTSANDTMRNKVVTQLK